MRQVIYKNILSLLPLLKVGGVFVFDDISWLPYLKNKKEIILIAK